jgi:hypothetical protein
VRRERAFDYCFISACTLRDLLAIPPLIVLFHTLFIAIIALP